MNDVQGNQRVLWNRGEDFETVMKELVNSVPSNATIIDTSISSSSIHIPEKTPRALPPTKGRPETIDREYVACITFHEPKE